MSIEDYDDNSNFDDEILTESNDEYEPDPNGIYVSPDGNNLNDGSYNAPFKTIARAVYNAKDGKTVYLANGTYNITSTISLGSSLTFTSYDGGTPVINAQNSCSILKLTKNAVFTFKGITFANGYAENGGVIDFLNFNQYTGTFFNCTFVNNTAVNYGGVFYEGRDEKMFSMSDKLYLTSCSFYNNSASKGSIYYGGSNTFSCLIMQYCVSIGNTNPAIFATSNRDGSLLENYWGSDGLTNVVQYSGTTSTVSKLTLISDNENPTIDDKIFLTAKLITSEGLDFSSNVYIPQIPVTFSSTSGNLSITRTNIVNNKGQTVLTPSEIGNVTINATIFNSIISKTLTILPSPQYVSADAEHDVGDGSFDNPYSLKDAIEAVNNGANNKICLFEGNYEFNGAYLLTRDVTICAYSTPYKTDKVNIKANDGFLILSNDIDVNLYNLTISNSNSNINPIFDIHINSTLNIRNIVLKDNILTGDASAIIANVGEDSCINIEYSQIVNNNAVIQNIDDCGYLFKNQGTILANNNWWGSNEGPFYTEFLSLGNEINSTNWMVLTKVQQEKEVLRTEWTSTFIIKLMDNFNNSIDEYLPEIDITFKTNTGSLDVLEFTLNDKNGYCISNKISQITEEATVECLADGEDLKIKFLYEIPLTEIFISVNGDDELGDGSLENSFLTINKAISRAKESGATIYFLTGCYDVSAVCEKLFHDNNAGGLNKINNRNLTLSSYNGKVIFDRSNSYYVFGFESKTNVSIIGIDFVNTNFTTGSKMGAIQSTGILIIKNCSFSNVTQGGNFAEFIGIDNGGKLYLFNSNFTNIGVSGISNSNSAIKISGSKTYVYVNNCYFANNGFYKTAVDDVVVYEFGNTESAFRCQNGFIEVENSRFENSSRIAMIYDHGKMSFKNSIFNNNGGLPCLHVSSHAYGFNVTNCTFSNNKAGAIGVSVDYLDDNEINIYDSTFINNTATNGGAISLAKAGAIISNCYFEGNKATNGGAVYNSYASLLIEHCEFYNNTALSKGGSIYTEGTDDYIDIQYNVFVNSKAEMGGVIYNNGITSLFYNIMTNGTAVNGSYIYNSNRAGNIYIKILNNESITSYKNTKIEINAFVSDDMANPITGGEVILRINDESIYLTANEGIVSTNYTFEKEGTYVIDGNYTGSRRYIVIVGTATINVVKKATTLTVPAVDVYYPLKNNVSVLLKDCEGNPISNANVQINIDGTNYLVITDENGFAKQEFELGIGKYDVIVKFDETDDYYSSNQVSTINVLSTIIANDMARGYNSGVDFKATLLNVDGTPLANAIVTIKINNDDYNLTTDSNGVVTLNQKLNIGNYEIMIINPINNENLTKKLSIVKRIVGNSNLVMSYMDGSRFKIQIIGDDGNPVGSGQIVTIKINNQKYAPKTDKNGYAYIDIKVTPKTYTIIAEYKGYKTTNKLTVKRVLKVSNVKVKKTKKSFKIKVSLNKVGGKYLVGKKITLKFKGKTYKAKTNKKGVATFNFKKKVIKKLKANKKYSFTATYIKDVVKKYVIVKK